MVKQSAPIKNCCGRRLKDYPISELAVWSTRDASVIPYENSLWGQDVHQNQRCGYLCTCPCGYQAICRRCVKRLGLIW